VLSGPSRGPRAALLTAVAATTIGAPLLAGCSTSAPAELDPSASPLVTVPSPAPTETLLSDQAADTSVVGSLAPGFPTDLVPVPAGAEVLMSSAQPVEGSDLTQISLNLRTAQDTAGLLDAVRGPLLAAGFAEGTPPQTEAGLAAQATFARADGAELLVVGILDRDGERTLTLGGQVRVGS